MAIEWDRLKQQEFDRIVEALFCRLYPDAEEVRAVNGRGGDGGCDIIVRQGGRLRIVQLKYFPEGFSGGFGHRRAQIKKSFERAMEQQPYAWVLVAPCTLTLAEQDFVEELGAELPAKVSVIDRAKLDAYVGRYPDIEGTFTRDKAREFARVLSREEDVLLDGVRAIDQRYAELGSLVDNQDLHWTLEYSRENGQTTKTLRPKHSNAAAVSPVHLEMEADLRAAPEGLRLSLDRMSTFGVPDSVTLPPEIVKRLALVGPEWLSFEESGVEVTWTTSPYVPPQGAKVTVRLHGANDTLLGSHVGDMVSGARGSGGVHIFAKYFGAAELRFLLPLDKNDRVTLNVNFELAEDDPVTVLRVVALYRHLRACGRLVVLIDDAELASFSCPEFTNAPDQFDDKAIDQLAALAEDLDIIQRHTSTTFPIPDGMPMSDRLLIRFMRLLIDGNCVLHPSMRGFTATLNGQDGSEIRKIVSGEPAMMRLIGPVQFEICGHLLCLGEVSIFHPGVVAENHEAYSAASL